MNNMVPPNKRVCTEAAAEHYICSLFKRSMSWNISTVTSLLH